MEQAQKTTAKSEAERDRVFGLKTKGAVVQAQFFKRLPESAVLVRFYRIQPGEHHRLHFLKTGQRLGGGILGAGNGIADLRVGNGFNVGEEESNLASR